MWCLVRHIRFCLFCFSYYARLVVSSHDYTGLFAFLFAFLSTENSVFSTVLISFPQVHSTFPQSYAHTLSSGATFLILLVFNRLSDRQGSRSIGGLVQNRCPIHTLSHSQDRPPCDGKATRIDCLPLAGTCGCISPAMRCRASNRVVCKECNYYIG